MEQLLFLIMCGTVGWVVPWAVMKLLDYMGWYTPESD